MWFLLNLRNTTLNILRFLFYVLLCVLCIHSSFAIISMGKRELVALLCLTCWCLMNVVWLSLTMPWACLQFVIVVSPDNTHFFVTLHFLSYIDKVESRDEPIL